MLDNESTIPPDKVANLKREAKVIAGLQKEDMTKTGSSIGIKGLTGNTIKTEQETGIRIRPKDTPPAISAVDVVIKPKNSTSLKSK